MAGFYSFDDINIYLFCAAQITQYLLSIVLVLAE